MATTPPIPSAYTQEFPPSFYPSSQISSYERSIQRVAIIGGGPSGLVTLKQLLQKNAFVEVKLFERRDELGGVWHFDQTIAEEECRQRASGSGFAFPFYCHLGANLKPDQTPYWPSPAYHQMNGNVPRHLFHFPDQPWSTLTPSAEPVTFENYPSLDETFEYFQTYAKPLRDHCVCNAEVLYLRHQGSKWKLTIRDWADNEEIKTSLWDAVVICTGPYDFPSYPETDGFATVRAAAPQQIWHSKFYRSPKPFVGKRILILGNGNSGNDIAAHLAPICPAPIYRSIRYVSPHAFLEDPRIIDVPVVVKFDLDITSSPTAIIRAQLQDGQVLEVDIVIVAAGYHYEFPFLKVPVQPTHPEARATAEEPPVEIIDDGVRVTSHPHHYVASLSHHFLHAYHPTLAFIGLLTYSIVLPTIHAQASVLSRLWSGRLPLPSPTDLLVFERTLMNVDCRSDRDFHNCKWPIEEAYHNQLRRWVELDPDCGEHGIVVWDDERHSWRTRTITDRRLQLQARKEKLERRILDMVFGTNGES